MKPKEPPILYHPIGGENEVWVLKSELDAALARNARLEEELELGQQEYFKLQETALELTQQLLAANCSKDNLLALVQSLTLLEKINESK